MSEGYVRAAAAMHFYSEWLVDWVVGISEFATVKTANFSESYESFVLTILLRTPMFSPKNGFVLFLTESSGGLKFHEKKEIWRQFIHNS